MGTFWVQLLIQFYTDRNFAHFLHGLKMCMWFGYNPCFNFCYFFHFANFVIFWPQILWKCCDSGYLVSATPHTILYRLFFKLCTCVRHGLEMCMWFGYNPWIIFVTFSTLWTLSFSDLRFYESVVTVGTLLAQLLIQFYTDLCETLYMFFHGLEMCMWFGYNPWIHFCHFLCPATRKWRGIMLYPPKFWVSVRPSVCLSVRPSVRPSAPTTILVSATPPTVLGQSFWNFTGVLRMVWRYAYCFFQNPEIIFYHFFPIFNLDIFRPLYYRYVYGVCTLYRQLLLQFLANPFETLQVF